MPSGKIHVNYYKKFLPITVIIGLLLTLSVDIISAIMFVTGYFMGYYVEPDLDQIGITTSEGNAMRNFGIFGTLWVMYWFPYGYVLQHRSFISHFPFISTLFRLGYLFCIPALFALYYKLNINWNIVGDMFLWLWIGLGISDTIHYILDKNF